MTTDLAVIEAALDAATPGPWVAVEHSTIVQRREVMRDYLVAMIPNYSPETAANRDLIVLLRNTAAELVERVKAAEDQIADMVPRSWSGLMELLDYAYPEDMIPTREDDPTRDPGPRIVSLLRKLNTAEAAIDRVRELAESVPKTVAFNPSDAAYLSGQVDFAEAVLDALNHTDGITPESATSGQRNRFTSVNSAGADDTTLRARAEDATEPILRPTDQRYEPPAVDDESGCCR